MKGHAAIARALLLWRGCLLHIIKKPLSIFAVGFFVVLILSLAGLYRLMQLQSSSSNEPTQNFTVTETTDKTDTIFVDLQGAVEKPGIYELPQETRLIELLQKAHGLNPHADRYLIAKTFNLSKKIVDEEKIYIPFVQERQNSNSPLPERISINSSTKTQLELLPSVGAVTAQKIIDNRPFSTLEQLVDKKIVGEKTYEKVRELIIL